MRRFAGLMTAFPFGRFDETLRCWRLPESAPIRSVAMEEADSARRSSGVRSKTRAGREDDSRPKAA
jgi:hypothetical protein